LPALLFRVVQAWKGHAITPRTVGCSRYAQRTLVITHPYFVAGPAGSQTQQTLPVLAESFIFPG